MDVYEVIKPVQTFASIISASLLTYDSNSRNFIISTWGFVKNVSILTFVFVIQLPCFLTYATTFNMTGLISLLFDAQNSIWLFVLLVEFFVQSFSLKKLKLTFNKLLSIERSLSKSNSSFYLSAKFLISLTTSVIMIHSTFTYSFWIFYAFKELKLQTVMLGLLFNFHLIYLVVNAFHLITFVVIIRNQFAVIKNDIIESKLCSGNWKRFVNDYDASLNLMKDLVRIFSISLVLKLFTFLEICTVSTYQIVAYVLFNDVYSYLQYFHPIYLVLTYIFVPINMVCFLAIGSVTNMVSSALNFI